YEDLDVALDQLLERGYDAIRIDAFPHLVLADPEGSHELLPVWAVNDWGAPMRCRVRRILPELIACIAACGERGIAVGLSSWFRRDTAESWRLLCTPQRLAAAWLAVLDGIRDAGLLEHILYVDLCNEWPLPNWAPFLYGQDEYDPQGKQIPSMDWQDARSLQWIAGASSVVRAAYPQLALTTSIHPWGADPAPAAPHCDCFEPHLWIATGTDFYQRLGWTFQHKWDNSEFEVVACHGEALYRADPEHWLGQLRHMIDDAATSAARCQRPLITTECWGIVDYKDGPMLDWGWVKEMCAVGTRHAAASGAWAAIATSNFCGPQFVGMWRDIAWHRELTDLIKASPLPPWPSLLTGQA
ncbi:MAG: cellulase, partial [Planctomycetota bacterium]